MPSPVPDDPGALRITAVETVVVNAELRNWVLVKVRTDQAGAQILDVKFADKGKMLTLLARHLGLISDRRDTSEISDLLRAVLLEFEERRQPHDVTPEADWTPLPPAERPHGHHQVLPAPPGVDDDA